MNWSLLGVGVIGLYYFYRRYRFYNDMDSLKLIKGKLETDIPLRTVIDKTTFTLLENKEVDKYLIEEVPGFHCMRRDEDDCNVVYDENKKYTYIGSFKKNIPVKETIETEVLEFGNTMRIDGRDIFINENSTIIGELSHGDDVEAICQSNGTVVTIGNKLTKEILFYLLNPVN